MTNLLIAAWHDHYYLAYDTEDYYYYLHFNLSVLAIYDLKGHNLVVDD